MEIRAVLAEALNCIERARRLSPPKGEVEAAALRWELYASLQNILDAAAMAVAELGLRKPGSYSKLGEPLLEAGLISRESCDDIRLVALTRNVLAHAYRRLSAEDLDGIVREVLPRAEGVVRELAEALEGRGVDPPTLEGRLVEVARVLERRGVRLAYLFGSRARGAEREDSDYDIAVLFGREGVTVVDEVGLSLEVARALRVPADRVDLVSLDSADPLLVARVLKEGVPIYAASEEDRRRWEREKYLEVLRATDLYAVYASRALSRASRSPLLLNRESYDDSSSEPASGGGFEGGIEEGRCSGRD